jgi:hypothetical protein
MCTTYSQGTDYPTALSCTSQVFHLEAYQNTKKEYSKGKQKQKYNIQRYKKITGGDIG